MNKERLRKLAQHLDKMAPEKFDMGTWCGMPCCIGAHAQRLFRLKVGGVAKYLDIEDKDYALFLPSRRTGAYDATPKQAAKVIRHLIKHGVVDWERFVK